MRVSFPQHVSQVPLIVFSSRGETSLLAVVYIVSLHVRGVVHTCVKMRTSACRVSLPSGFAAAGPARPAPHRARLAPLGPCLSLQRTDETAGRRWRAWSYSDCFHVSIPRDVCLVFRYFFVFVRVSGFRLESTFHVTLRFVPYAYRRGLSAFGTNRV